MGAMFKQLWTMLTVLFLAGERLSSALGKTANALDHLGTWCDESAGAFADQARIEREQKKALLLSTLNSPTSVTSTSNLTPLPIINGAP